MGVMQIIHWQIWSTIELSLRMLFLLCFLDACLKKGWGCLDWIGNRTNPCPLNGCQTEHISLLFGHAHHSNCGRLSHFAEAHELAEETLEILMSFCILGRQGPPSFIGCSNQILLALASAAYSSSFPFLFQDQNVFAICCLYRCLRGIDLVDGLFDKRTCVIP